MAFGFETAQQAIAQAISAAAAERRRNRERVPTVGPHGANQVRLTPELRAMLMRRVTREVHQETDPTIAALQAQLPALRQSLHRERRSIEGANDMAAAAIGDISLKGLHGATRRQVAQELTQRQADVAASLPFQISDARSEFKSQKADLAEKIAMAQAQQQEGIASTLHSALSAARTDAQATVKARQAKEQAHSKAQHEGARDAHRQLNLAMAEAKRLLETYSGQIPQTEAQWSAFAGEVAKGEGISSPHAVDLAIAKIKKILERGKTRFSQQVGADTAAAGFFAPLMQAIDRGDFTG